MRNRWWVRGESQLLDPTVPTDPLLDVDGEDPSATVLLHAPNLLSAKHLARIGVDAGHLVPSAQILSLNASIM